MSLISTAYRDIENRFAPRTRPRQGLAFIEKNLIPALKGALIMSRFVLCLLVVLCIGSEVRAAGITTHMFMSEKAIENVDDPRLRSFLEERRDAVLGGSCSPDWGGGLRELPFQKAPGQSMYEAHTPEYIEAFLTHIMEKCGPPYTGECGKLAAMFLGTAAHNMEDDVYDEIFLREVRRRDIETGSLDTSLDLILLVDHDRWLVSPKYYVPAEDVSAVYRQVGVEIKPWQVRAGARMHKAGLVGERLIALPVRNKEVKITPWAAENIYSYPGGVEYCGQVVARYWKGLWDILHGRQDTLPAVIRMHPEDGGKIATDGYVTAVFPRSIIKALLNEHTFRIEDESGNTVPTRVRCMQKESDYTRVCSMLPEAPLQPGKSYTYHISSEIRFYSQKNLPHPVKGTFYVK